jgi:hypothetical protein
MIDQEYYCKFIESATNFFRGIPEVCTLEPVAPNALHQFQMGVDLAKYNDYTVISVMDLNTFEQVHMERFNKMDWDLQKSRVEAVYHRFGRPKGYIDATGVGDPIVEDLRMRGVMLEPFKFTETNRKDLLVNLQMLIEQKRIKLRNDPILMDELGYFQYDLTDSGKLTIKVPGSLHDDTVFGTGLSCWQLPPKPVRLNRQKVQMQQTTGITPMYGGMEF